MSHSETVIDSGSPFTVRLHRLRKDLDELPIALVHRLREIFDELTFSGLERHDAALMFVLALLLISGEEA